MSNAKSLSVLGFLALLAAPTWSRPLEGTDSSSPVGGSEEKSGDPDSGQTGAQPPAGSANGQSARMMIEMQPGDMRLIDVEPSRRGKFSR